MRGEATLSRNLTAVMLERVAPRSTDGKRALPVLNSEARWLVAIKHEVAQGCNS